VGSSDQHPRIASDGHWIARRPAPERRALEDLEKLGLHLNREGQRALRQKDFLPAVSRLLDAGWEVQAEACRIRGGGRLSLSLQTGQDWFDLEGAADFDGQMAPLPAILEAARNGARFVKLGDGSLGLLPETWARQWGLLETLGDAEGDGIRFRTNQAWLLDALLAADETLRTDESFGALHKRIGTLSAPRPLAAPRTFKGTLRPYQQEALGWLTYLHRAGFGGCLADDMGLGKTIEVLAHLARLPRAERGPSLLVAPRSLVFNWIAEARRFTPALRLLDLSGPGRKARMAEIPDHDLALTTYGCLRRDIEALREHRFRYAILDEAQAVKNASTQGAKAARLLPADHRLALSGTPVENHLGELWSLFEFLNPGMLGRSRAFAALSQKNGAEIDEPQRGALARAVQPFVLRRTKVQVLPDLPDRSDSVIPCALRGRQQRDYAAIRDRYRQQILSGPGEDLGRNKIQILEALLRLRQVACHPGLADPSRSDESSAKLDALWPMLDELQQEGHKVLVFSQFTSFLDIIQKRLARRRISFERLDGRTRDRDRRVARFQDDPECRIFLISLKAGGLGLNLTAADYVILMDPWWNPAVESQAIDRAHRFGQTRKVFAYRMVAQGTIEEKILALQQEKRALADQIFTADNALLRDITAEDLRFLLT
jgi:SNF2 family DNA or RNA helicase